MGVEETSRRALLSAGLGFTFLSTARAAYAILPDDDDEELIQRAKAKRASKIKEELAAERNFVGITKPTEEEIKTVQLAVAKMVKTGALIEQGDTENAASVIGTSSTPWASNLTSRQEEVRRSCERACWNDALVPRSSPDFSD